MEKAKKMKKPLKITLIVISVILVLLIISALILPKTIAMSVYNEYFGIRYTSYEPTTWELSDFEGLSAEKHRFYSDKGQEKNSKTKKAKAPKHPTILGGTNLKY